MRFSHCAPNSQCSVTTYQAVPKQHQMVCAVGILIATFTIGCSNTLGDALGKYGYVELRPPSTLLSPGTIITIENNNPLQAGITCPQVDSLGPNLPLQISDSAENEIAKKATGEFNIDANYLEQIKAQAKYSSIETIKLTLSNVRVQELSDSSVFDKVSNRSDACVRAMDFRREQHAKVSMVKSVLSADAIYTVAFQSQAQLDASAKAEIIKGLSLELGASLGTATANTFSGKGLYWGIKDDQKLALIGRDRTLSINASVILNSKDIESAIAELSKKASAIPPTDGTAVIRIVK